MSVNCTPNRIFKQEINVIKVSIEFKTVEDAIIGLGKLGNIAAPAQDAQSAPKSERKPRNDAGKIRGAYKKPEHPVNTLAAQLSDAKVPSSTPPPAPVVVTPAEQASPNEPTAADAQKVMEILFNTKGFKIAQEMVLKHGAPRVRDLPIENRLAFIREAAAQADAVNSAGSQP
jgi:hypothetical protein